jgi:asparagine synthase (glutamine-hydrolysing)
MAAALRHRGPDDEGFFADTHAVLGARRLSIVDVAGGRQPIASEDGSVQAVCNGEIYNFHEERARLEAAGHRFRSGSDSEVVVHAYEEEGVASFARLNGIFAVAVWDAARQRLVLARDPLGVKPLYYTWDGATLAFASEIKALLMLPGARRAVDAEALDLYLAFRFVPSPRTLFQGVLKVGPGEILELDAGTEPRLSCYAPPPPTPDPRPSSAEWVERLTLEVRAAVRRQMMGDVPLGVLLSGGTDSAAILAYATEAAGAPLHAYTVGFDGDPALDEILAAAATAVALGAVHRHRRLTFADHRRRLLTAVRALDEPIGTTSIAAFDLLCSLAGGERKAVLSGQGADEPFGGYRRHAAEKLAGGRLGRLLALPAAVASGMRPGSDALERAARVAAAGGENERFAETLALFPRAERARLQRRSETDSAPPAELTALAARAAHLDPLGRFLYLDSRFGLADDLLLYADKIGMASSLEVRVPFLDLELLRFVETIPAPLRVSTIRPKRLLKRAIAGVVPAEVRVRPKRNFSPPHQAWLAPAADGPCADWLLDRDAAVAEYLDREEIARLLREQREGRRDRRRQLFALLAFEIWHRTFIDGRLRPDQ